MKYARTISTIGKREGHTYHVVDVMPGPHVISGWGMCGLLLTENDQYFDEKPADVRLCQNCERTIEANAKKPIKMVVELTYNNKLMHGTDGEEKAWLLNLLKSEVMLLHSNEIGDTVGSVKVVKILKK